MIAPLVDVTVNVWTPVLLALIVLPDATLTAPLVLLAIVELPVNVTGPVNVIAPVVVIFPSILTPPVVPVVDKLFKGVPPTVPPNLTTPPPAFSVKA